MQYLKQIWAILAIGWACSGALMAQSSTIYFALNKLDNRQARIHGPGAVDDTFSTKTPFEVVLNHNSTYTLEINPEKLVASLELNIDRSGNITSVSWKDADGSQTGGGYTSLSTSYYALNEPDELTLYPANMDIVYEQTSLGSIWFPEVWLSTLTGGSNSMSLFPGDYEIHPGDHSNNAGVCHLALEVMASNGGWGTSPEWKEYLQMGPNPPAWTPLNTNYYSFPLANKLQLEGKDIYIDKQIDNDQLYYVNYEHLGSGSESLGLFPGNFFVSVGVGEGISAYVGMLFDMGLDQIQDNIVWLDPDSSQTGGPVPLDTGYVVTAGDTIRLKGVEVKLDLFANSNTVYFLNVAPGGLATGYNDLELFPGDYLVKVGGTATHLKFEIWPEGRLSNKVNYLDYYDPAIPQEQLHPACYYLTPDSLKLHGREVDIDMTYLPNDAMEFPQLASGQGNITSGQVTTLQLIPAGYYTDITPQGDSEPRFRTFFRLKNRGGKFENPIMWKDLALGGDPYLPDSVYEGHSVYLRAGAISYYRLPKSIVIPYQDRYAMLERKIDGEWLKLEDRILRFQYTGEYDNGALAFRLMNWHREDINVTQFLNLSLNKVHGDNRYALVLPGGVAVGHYVLEVTNEKNETFFLRFEVE